MGTTVDVSKAGFGIWEFNFLTQAPLNEAYGYIADIERHGEWEPSLMAVQRDFQKGKQVGGRYKKTYAAPPANSSLERLFSIAPSLTLVIIALEPPFHLAWQERYPDPEGHDDVHTCDFFFERAGDRTRVTRRQAFIRLPKWVVAQLEKGDEQMRQDLRKHPPHGLRKKLLEFSFGRERLDMFTQDEPASPSVERGSEVDAIARGMERLCVILDTRRFEYPAKSRDRSATDELLPTPALRSRFKIFKPKP
jgi:hypothetical protein